MKVDQSTYLLDLPHEVLQKIVEYIPFATVRKNLRLTCKQLHSLCNWESLCRDEVIRWPKCDDCRDRMIDVFANSTRECYNLVFKSVTLKVHHESQFFEQHGAKIRSLLFRDCRFRENALASIITYCEGLISLNIDDGICSYNFSFESNLVIRPSVTSLAMELPYCESESAPDLFHRIQSTFPCLKHLDIKFCGTNEDNDWRKYDEIRAFPVVLNGLLNFSHLESLNLEILRNDFLAKEPQFPKLKKLHLLIDFDWAYYEHENNFDYDEDDGSETSILLRNTWPTFISRLNGVGVSSITIKDGYKINLIYKIMPLIYENGVENLTLDRSDTIPISLEDFKVLVSSHLKKIHFRGDLKAPWVHTIENFPVEANKTMIDLKLSPCSRDDSDRLSLVAIILTYFHGLVHLEIYDANDVILQRICEYQKNLRSLILGNCKECSEAGFFGTKDFQCENSITSLQKLEHLEVNGVDIEIIQSEQWQTEFSFPRLKYLKISLSISELRPDSEPKSEILVNMLTSCVNLEAVNLIGFVAPPSTVLSSLFQSLKYLHYLRINPSHYYNEDGRTYVNLKHFYWIDWKKSLSKCSPKDYHYDPDLDRIVFQNVRCVGGETIGPLYSPKFCSHSVNWIVINHR